VRLFAGNPGDLEMNENFDVAMWIGRLNLAALGTCNEQD